MSTARLRIVHLATPALLVVILVGCDNRLHEPGCVVGRTCTPPFDGAAPDANGVPGTDSAPPPRDAGPDVPEMLLLDAAARVDSGPPGCSSPAECDDGLACNGEESCMGGRCAAGMPPLCDDAIDCTRDLCIEPTTGTEHTCNFVPDDALCQAGESCGESGCSEMCAGELRCRLVAPQCGCADGEGCYLDDIRDDEPACMSAGTAGEGDPCGAVNDCAPGLQCVSTGPYSGASHCARSCNSSYDCSGNGSSCSTWIGLSDFVCTIDCDPVTQTGCTTGTSCLVARDVFLGINYTDCYLGAGTGDQGDRCLYDTDCAPGYRCYNRTSCLHYCQDPFGAGSGCPSGTSCHPLATPLIVGAIEYGLCL